MCFESCFSSWSDKVKLLKSIILQQMNQWYKTTLILLVKIFFRLVKIIVIWGDWLWMAANINNYYKTVKLKVYVGSSTVVHKPLWLNETFLLANTIKMLECYWSKHYASSGQQKHITKASDRFHNYSTQLTMFKCTLAANRGFSLVWPLAFMKLLWPKPANNFWP